MEALINYLSHFDLFGFSIKFRHNKFIKYRTHYGGILTIFCLIFFSISFLEISKDCFYKTNPFVRETSYYKENNIVNATSLFFSLYFTDENNTLIENPEKFLIFHGVIKDFTTQNMVKTIDFQKCDYNKHFKSNLIIQKKIKEKNLYFDKSYCLNLGENFTLMNSGNEIPRISLSIYVIECINKTIHGVDYNGTCEEKSKIDMRIKSFYVNSFFYNSFVLAEDIDYPNQANIKRESLKVSNDNYYEKLYVTYKNSGVIMDRGLIFQDKIFVDNIKISSFIPDQAPKTCNYLGYNIIYNVEIDADHFTNVTYVKFLKIQEALASLGGIISIVKIIFGSISLFINKFNFAFDLFTEVYLKTNKFMDLNTNEKYNSSFTYKEIHNNFNANKLKLTNKIGLEYHKKSSSNLIGKITFSKENSTEERKKRIKNASSYNKRNHLGFENYLLIKPKPIIKIENENILEKEKKNFQKKEKLAHQNKKYTKKNTLKSNEKDNRNIILRIPTSKRIEENSFVSLNNLIEKGIKKKDSSSLTFKGNLNNDDENIYFNSKNDQKNLRPRSCNEKIRVQEELTNFYKNVTKSQIRNEGEFERNINVNNMNLNLILQTKNLKLIDPIDEEKNLEINNHKRGSYQGNYLCNIEKIQNNNSYFIKNQKVVFDKKKRQKTVKFRATFKNWILALICKKKEILLPLKIMMNKISREMEIKNYLKLKEDLLKIKELMFDKKSKEFFELPLEFKDILLSIREDVKFGKNTENPVFNYIRNSFGVDNDKNIYFKKNPFLKS